MLENLEPLNVDGKITETIYKISLDQLIYLFFENMIYFEHTKAII